MAIQERAPTRAGEPAVPEASTDSAVDPGPLKGRPTPGRGARRHGKALLNTRSLGTAAVSLGGALAGAAVLAPSAEACWSRSIFGSTCRTYVSRNVQHSIRNYGPWASSSGYVNSNRAHYNDCVQLLVSDPPAHSKFYTHYHCNYSAWMSGTNNFTLHSQGLAWRYQGGCGFMWAREKGYKIKTSKFIYGAC